MIQIDQNAQVSSATSRMFSTNLPCIKVYHDDEWHVASPSHKGCSHRASNFRRPNVESRIFENAVDILKEEMVNHSFLMQVIVQCV